MGLHGLRDPLVSETPWPPGVCLRAGFSPLTLGRSRAADLSSFGGSTVIKHHKTAYSGDI